MYNKYDPTTLTNYFGRNSTILTTEQPQSDFHCCNWFGLYNYLVVLFVLLTGLCILCVKMIVKTRRRRYRRLEPANITTVNGTNFTTPHPQNINWTNQYPPWQISTIPPEDPGIIITDEYWYWNGFYYFYFSLILIICIGVVAGALARQKRLAEQHRRARQRAQANSQSNDTNNGCGLTPPSYIAGTESAIPSSDCPPTYESAMRNYIDAKQHLHEMEANAMGGGGMAMAASTTTIETCISEVDLRTAPSVVDLSATNEPINNTNTVVSKPTQQ